MSTEWKKSHFLGFNPSKSCPDITLSVTALFWMYHNYVVSHDISHYTESKRTCWTATLHNGYSEKESGLFETNTLELIPVSKKGLLKNPNDMVTYIDSYWCTTLINFCVYFVLETCWCLSSVESGAARLASWNLVKQPSCNEIDNKCFIAIPATYPLSNWHGLHP